MHSASPGQGEHAGCASLCAVGLSAPMFCRPARPSHGLPDLSPNALRCPTGAELSSCSPRSFPHPHRYRSVTSQYWGPRCHRSATAAVTPSPPHRLAQFGVAVGRGGRGDAPLSVPTHTVALEMLTAIFHSIFGKNAPSSQLVPEALLAARAGEQPWLLPVGTAAFVPRRPGSSWGRCRGRAVVQDGCCSTRVERAETGNSSLCPCHDYWNLLS